MNFRTYISELQKINKISAVKLMILERLWHTDDISFPKPWVSSKELLELTKQKYFDRRTRELRDQFGCDIESSYEEELNGHAWRINSSSFSTPINREYLSKTQKQQLFEEFNFSCATCGKIAPAGIRGLQADHKIPLSRGGTNNFDNWQPLCNNCNVGKRRACEKCSLDCSRCSWAFPDKIGVKTVTPLKESTLRKVNIYCSENEEKFDEFFEKAIDYYLNSENS